MKHLLSILILLGFMSVANAVLTIPLSKTTCISNDYVWNYKEEICQSGYDLSNIGSGLDEPFIPQEVEKNVIEEIQDVYVNSSSAQKENQIILVVSVIIAAFIIYLIVSASIKKTKEAYKASNIPLKNKVKRKELKSKLAELEEVTPAEQTFAKTSYEDETEEIREVKKLERQIKIKKLKKELKDLEAEEE